MMGRLWVCSSCIWDGVAKSEYDGVYFNADPNSKAEVMWSTIHHHSTCPPPFVAHLTRIFKIAPSLSKISAPSSVS